MKMPKKPPDLDKIWKKTITSPQRATRIFGQNIESHIKGKYPHWDKLLHYAPPEGFSHEEWWLALKWQRKLSYKQISLCDKKGTSFGYCILDPIPEMLHKIDQGAGGIIQMEEQITNPQTKDQYYVSSLIQEAITSSQLEGAATTLKIAKEMIKSGRAPQDKSEQMILNNFETMRRIEKMKSESLSKELIFEIHRLITNETLKVGETGRFRNANESIVVGDMYNEVFHNPPDAKELDARMADMCAFANGKTPDFFIHPVVRSIILHFRLAYDHPFIDGNGRTARALFYWSMLKHGYWLFEFISISQIILKAPVKYYRAFLYTETDENDLTYFILYHLDIIRRAIEELHAYIRRKTERLQKLEQELQGINTLNHRQRALINHALRHPQQKYTMKSHKTSHNIVYQTSRLDLFDLEKRGLLKSRKVGKTWYFMPVENLEEKLSSLS